MNNTKDSLVQIFAKINGIKCLIFDDETINFISSILTNVELSNNEIFLYEKISDKNVNKYTYMNVIYFVRPTLENINMLISELCQPRFKEYYIYFSNGVSDNLLKDLSKADKYNVVCTVEELYLDYVVDNVNNNGNSGNLDSWHLNLRKCTSEFDLKNNNKINRIVEGINAYLISNNITPLIRYQKSSLTVKDICSKLNKSKSHDLKTLLLVIDRNEDYLSPLLTSWTYKAMIHQYFTLKNKTIDLTLINNESVNKLPSKILSFVSDDFYSTNIFTGYGEICTEVEKLVKQHKIYIDKSKNMTTTNDLKSIIYDIPKAKKEYNILVQHLTVLQEIQGKVKQRNMIDLSALEQNIICSNNKKEMYDKIVEYSKKGEMDDLVRIIILFALKYESDVPMINSLKELLGKLHGKEKGDVNSKIIDFMLLYGGAVARSKSNDIFNNKKYITNITHTIKREITGVGNVFQQYEPYIVKLVNDALNNILSVNDYPYINNDNMVGAQINKIIIFVVGGTTYYEEYSIYNTYKKNNNLNISLGGTFIHNPVTFLEDIN